MKYESDFIVFFTFLFPKIKMLIVNCNTARVYFSEALDIIRIAYSIISLLR